MTPLLRVVRNGKQSPRVAASACAKRTAPGIGCLAWKGLGDAMALSLHLQTRS